MTPVTAFRPPGYAVVERTGTQGPPGVQGPPPALAMGNTTTLAPGSDAQAQLRANPAGGYFLDLGIPGAPAGTLTQTAAEALFAQLAPADGTYRIVTNGNGTFLEIYNPTQQAWHTIAVNGAVGQEALAIQPADT